MGKYPKKEENKTRSQPYKVPKHELLTSKRRNKATDFNGLVRKHSKNTYETTTAGRHRKRKKSPSKRQHHEHVKLSKQSTMEIQNTADNNKHTLYTTTNQYGQIETSGRQKEEDLRISKKTASKRQLKDPIKHRTREHTSGSTKYECKDPKIKKHNHIDSFSSRSNRSYVPSTSKHERVSKHAINCKSDTFGAKKQILDLSSVIKHNYSGVQTEKTLELSEYADRKTGNKKLPIKKSRQKGSQSTSSWRYKAVRSLKNKETWRNRNTFSRGSRTRRRFPRQSSRTKQLKKQRYINNILKEIRRHSERDPCDIVMIFVGNTHKFEKYLQLAKENTEINVAFLDMLNKAFKSYSTPGSLLTFIHMMEINGFIENSINQILRYLRENEDDCNGQTETIVLESIMSILRVMINDSVSRLIKQVTKQDGLTNKDCQSEDLTNPNSISDETIKVSKEQYTHNIEISRKHTNAIDSIHLSRNHPSLDMINALLNSFSIMRIKTTKLQQRRMGTVKNSLNQAKLAVDNFRDISIIPDAEDVHERIDPKLRANIIVGAYTSVDDYLDVQFRLLREDFMQPLRKGIKSFIAARTKTIDNKIQEINVYEHVQIESLFFGEGLNYMLSFDTSKYKHIRWNSGKRLKYGSMVCLSSDTFNTCFFAIIVDSDVQNRKEGRLQVKFDDEPQLVKQLMGLKLIMVETTAYFESYRPVLHSLQGLREEDFPFRRYIVECENQVSPPAYFKEDTDFDLRCLVDSTSKVSASSYFATPGEKTCSKKEEFDGEIEPLRNVNILNTKRWPLEDKLNVDPSQLRTLQNVLTKEFSITQGPPGCGKTYIGLLIAKALLHNRKTWCREDGSRGQLLVVCYTNHALDQFLEGIVKFFEGDILRVGSRSLSEVLMNRRISEIRKSYREARAFPPDVTKARSSAVYKLQTLKDSLNLIAEGTRILKHNIVREETLYEEMGPLRDQFMWLRRKSSPQWLEFLGNSLMVEWLGLKEMAIEIQRGLHNDKNDSNEDDDADLIEEKENIDIDEEAFYGKSNTESLKPLEQFRREHLALDLDLIQTFSSDEFPEQVLENTKDERRRLVERIKSKLQQTSSLHVIDIQKIKNLSLLSLSERWALYWHWVTALCEKRNSQFEKSINEYEIASARHKEALMMESIFLFKQAHIIGMTITGAAKYINVLREVKPKIMIVEEAAEVFESHLVSNLTSGCQQIILIGDHKQLQPKPNVYKLETHYKMAVSLFERMILNKLPYECLQEQHRMRPEIADNIRLIYQTLYDHEKVKNYDNVLGMDHNIFFINHSTEETDDPELKSYVNEYEINFIIALFQYLLMQGYKPSEITILTPYNGQLFSLRKKLQRRHIDFEGVRTTTVDNYQGEENEIILLSLVRSNTRGQIGYLAQDNRVCVSLSRAKKGLYVVGNFDQLSSHIGKTILWRSIVSNMKSKGLCANTLTLRCQNHPLNVTTINSPDDFTKAPFGGCGEICGAIMKCGHACEKICHTLDREHKDIVCRKPCIRQCYIGHTCKKLCFQVCNCEEEIIVLLSACGHQIQMRCQQVENTNFDLFECEQMCRKPLSCGHTCTIKCCDNCICMIPVKKRIPACNHENDIPCQINPRKFKCRVKCVKSLPCGHGCEKMCGEKCGPCKHKILAKHLNCEHEETIYCYEDINNISCKRKCNRIMDCGHPCQDICGKNLNEVIVQEETLTSHCPAGHISVCKTSCHEILRCGHQCQGTCGSCYQGRWHRRCSKSCDYNLVCGHYSKSTCGMFSLCQKRCLRRCRHIVCDKNCDVICKKCTNKCNWKCEHLKCNKTCGEVCDRTRCNKTCRKLLDCGHNCIGMCGDPCPTLCRICNKQEIEKYAFANEIRYDTRFVQMQDCGHIMRYDKMDAYMDVDEGLSIKRCPICQKAIRATNGNRYEKVVNQFNIKLNALKTQLVNEQVFWKWTLEELRSNESYLVNESFLRNRCVDFVSDTPSYSLENREEECNALNRAIVSSFIRLFHSDHSVIKDKTSFFPNDYTLVASKQQVKEVEREINRNLDQMHVKRLIDQFLAERDITDENCQAIREWKLLNDAMNILQKKAPYTEKERMKIMLLIDQLPPTLTRKNAFSKVSIQIADKSLMSNILKTVEDAHFEYKQKSYLDDFNDMNQLEKRNEEIKMFIEAVLHTKSVLQHDSCKTDSVENTVNIMQLVSCQRRVFVDRRLTQKRRSTQTMEDEPVSKRSREESSKYQKSCTRKKTGDELSKEKVRPEQKKMSSLSSSTKANKTNTLNKSHTYNEQNLDTEKYNNQRKGKELYSVVREKQSEGLCKSSEDFDGSLQTEEDISKLTNLVRYTTNIKSNDLRNVINTIRTRKEQDKQTGEAVTFTKSRNVQGVNQDVLEGADLLGSFPKGGKDELKCDDMGTFKGMDCSPVLETCLNNAINQDVQFSLQGELQHPHKRPAVSNRSRNDTHVIFGNTKPSELRRSRCSEKTVETIGEKNTSSIVENLTIHGNRTEKTSVSGRCFSNNYKSKTKNKERPKCTSTENVLNFKSNREKQYNVAENDKLCEDDDTWFVIDEV